MYHSFILIPSPQICGDDVVKRHKQLVASYPGVFAEILDIVALRCDDISEIPSMVANICSQYKTKRKTDKNLAVLTTAIVCNNHLKENPLGMEKNDGMIQFLKKYDIEINDKNCIYLPIPDCHVTVALYDAEKMMEENN